MKRLLKLICAASFAVAAFCQSAQAQGPGITPEAWGAYKAKFLDASGRIVDDANGNISHSEGQGYGLLLAYLANSPADFEQIWYFTRTELLLRDDGLAAWKWDPTVTPHITDTNNASDGDLLIAYALALAGSAWKKGEYIEAAAKMAQALLSHLVINSGGRTLLLPGASGFDSPDRKDGPIINPSYWVYEAIPVMALLAPSSAWQKLSDDGLALLRAMQFGPRKLPADWVSLNRMPEPAAGFDAEFGYNSLRIPLYLVRAGVSDKALLARLREGMTAEDGVPATIDLASGKPKTLLPDPGYRIVNDVVACVTNGTKLPESSQRFEPSLYYPSTLHLLGLAFIGEKHPECL
ncbi:MULTISPECIES: glycosyl hydrolase family 8 [unclassified Rhizobium]|uniref:glycosyl hydrolase family 8 n=1 Tax=unclassified Rhizobium TaxID=2613769 RepID=UPI001612526C|nr:MULTISPECIES: glycosyl hydrolase family 8 [unclassified Rhizobium]MBB3542254.1 endoglucanase [Rhizobium sp. BK399]MCS3738113.1 endoglucanase [Rhizobium sp. BK661]MCS4092961.1 endoglucanase [Rhizobium sp. BK176]